MVVAGEVELRPGVRVGQMVGLDQRIRGRHHGRRVDLGDVVDGLKEVTHLLHGGDLRGELAGLADGRAVVVGGVDDGGGQPAPRGPAERHVDVLQLDAVGHVGEVELPLVGGPVEGPLEGVALPLPGCPAPRVEEAAAELRLEPRGRRAGAGTACRPAWPVVAPVRRRPTGRGVAVERVQVVGIRRWEAARSPEPVPSLVVVVDRDGDAVGAGLRVQVGQVVDAGGPAHVAGVLVLDLVQQQGPGTVSELVPGQDPVDRGEPLVGGGQVDRVGGAGHRRRGRQPSGEATRVHFGVDVRTGPGQDVDPGVRGHPHRQVHVADASEVVDA